MIQVGKGTIAVSLEELGNIYQNIKHLGPCDTAILSLRINEYEEYIKDIHNNVNYNSKKLEET